MSVHARRSRHTRAPQHPRRRGPHHVPRDRPFRRRGTAAVPRHAVENRAAALAYYSALPSRFSPPLCRSAHTSHAPRCVLECRCSGAMAGRPRASRSTAPECTVALARSPPHAPHARRRRAAFTHTHARAHAATPPRHVAPASLASYVRAPLFSASPLSPPCLCGTGTHATSAGPRCACSLSRPCDRAAAALAPTPCPRPTVRIRGRAVAFAPDAPPPPRAAPRPPPAAAVTCWPPPAPVSCPCAC